MTAKLMSDAPPCYNTMPASCDTLPTNYYTRPTHYFAAMRRAPKSQIRHFYLVYTILKIVVDLMCICGYDPSLGNGITTYPSVLQLFVDLFLLCSALSCDVTMLKFVEVFAYIFQFYYLLISILLLCFALFLRNEVEPIIHGLMDVFSSKDVPPEMQEFVTNFLNKTYFGLFKFWYYYEISYICSVISVTIRAYLAKKLIEHRILEKSHVREAIEMTTHRV